MQMQAAMVGLMSLAVGPGASPASPTPTTGTKQRFDLLLGHVRTSLATIVQEAGSESAIVKNGELASEVDELAASELDILAALLAQPLGRVMVTSWLQGQKNDEQVVAANAPAALKEVANVKAEIVHSPARESAESVANIPLQTTIAADGVTGRSLEQPSTTPIETAARQSLAELLAQLQAEVVQATVGSTDNSGTTPNRWGQLERYWALRGAGQAEPAESQQGAELSQHKMESFPDLKVGPPVVARRTEQSLPLEAASESLAEVFDSSAAPGLMTDISEPGSQGNQFAVYLAGVTDSSVVADTAAAAEVDYVARPGVSLEQQLEQGLVVGLRQLRLLRSPDGITVRMQLYPESLGEVRVELRVEGNTLTAQLRALEPQATEALRLELPLLRESLSNQGFTDVFLGAETADFLGHSAGREQQPFQEQRARRTQQIVGTNMDDLEELEAEPITGRLDYRL